MTDETTTIDADEAGPDTAVESDASETSAEVVADADATPALGGGPPRWFDRWVAPIVMPLAIVAGLIFYVLNVSRMFLATSGAGAVAIGVTITVGILVGAALLSAAPRMRTGSIVLVVAGFLALVLVGGTLTWGEAQPEEEAAALPPGQPAQELDIGSGNLFFDPTNLEAQTGFFELVLTNLQTGSHSFVVETPGVVTEKEKLEVSGEGSVDMGKFFVGEPGDYVFFCDIPGHRAAGMEGIIAVAGDSVTIEQAALDLGPPADGAGA